jgi:hypothetical protein
VYFCMQRVVSGEEEEGRDTWACGREPRALWGEEICLRRRAAGNPSSMISIVSVWFDNRCWQAGDQQ